MPSTRTMATAFPKQQHHQEGKKDFFANDNECDVDDTNTGRKKKDTINQTSIIIDKENSINATSTTTTSSNRTSSSAPFNNNNNPPKRNVSNLTNTTTRTTFGISQQQQSLSTTKAFRSSTTTSNTTTATASTTTNNNNSSKDSILKSQHQQQQQLEQHCQTPASFPQSTTTIVSNDGATRGGSTTIDRNYNTATTTTTTATPFSILSMEMNRSSRNSSRRRHPPDDSSYASSRKIHGSSTHVDTSLDLYRNGNNENDTNCHNEDVDDVNNDDVDHDDDEDDVSLLCSPVQEPSTHHPYGSRSSLALKPTKLSSAPLRCLPSSTHPTTTNHRQKASIAAANDINPDVLKKEQRQLPPPPQQHGNETSRTSGDNNRTVRTSIKTEMNTYEGNLSRPPLTSLRDNSTMLGASISSSRSNNNINNTQPRRLDVPPSNRLRNENKVLPTKSETKTLPPKQQQPSAKSSTIPASSITTTTRSNGNAGIVTHPTQQPKGLMMKHSKVPSQIVSPSYHHEFDIPQQDLTSTRHHPQSTISTFATPFFSSLSSSSSSKNDSITTMNSTTVNPTFSILLPQSKPSKTSAVAAMSTTSNRSISTVTYSRPENHNKKGICMDLSDVFLDAAHPAKAKAIPIMGTTTIKEATSKQDGHSPELIQRLGTESISTENVIRDEMDDQQHWAEKQVILFTKWMNFLFYPNNDQLVDVDPPQHANIATVPTVTSSTTALRTLVAHQQMAQDRKKAWSLFHNTDTKRIRDIISTEIGRNKIALRPDRDLYANLDHRNMILSLLLSYSTPWLRLGLETMFHTVILPGNPTLFSPKQRKQQPNEKFPHGGDIRQSKRSTNQAPLTYFKSTIRQFIVHHLLSDEKLLAKYTGGKCMVPSGPFDERYRTELRSVVLYRILILVIFLDHAKMSNVLEQAPNLFTSNSTVKSTREVLLYICRNFLKSEGDFIKHLSRLGIKVKYQQEPVDELDYTISNLRVDLNDGVRLGRMTELLTGASILPKLRLPAISRMQKLYNVKMAMDNLIEAGVPLSGTVAPYHIVDGHCEMVLKLLWSVVAHCCLQILLSVEQVETEISRIQQYHSLPQSYIRGDVDDLQQALLHWCNLICIRFGRNVHDFSDSFADGKVICLLIHYYHPTLIRLKEIKMTRSDKLALYGNRERLIANERYNGALANSRMTALGGIPEIIPICDTDHPPEEKAIVFCLTFLCSRLITSSVEIRACTIIQNGYKRYRDRILLNQKVSAASTILLAWRKNKDHYHRSLRLRYISSVRVIEQFIIANRESLYKLRLRRLNQEKTNVAAVSIQKIFRMFSVMKSVDNIIFRKQSAITLQCMWRQEMARRLVLNLLLRNDAANTIQRAWRKSEYKDALTHKAATVIQSIYRGYWCRVQFIIDVIDITVVQSCARRMLCRREYLTLRENVLKERHFAATCIQTLWRIKKSRELIGRINESTRQHAAAVVIQSNARKWRSKKALCELIYQNTIFVNAVKIQSCWRSFRPRMKLWQFQYHQRCNSCATKLQSYARKYIARCSFLSLQRRVRMLRAIKSIQALWRGWRSRSLVIRMQFAAIMIQATIRRSIAVRRFNLLQLCHRRIQAAVKIQRYCRTFSAKLYVQKLMREIVMKNLSAITIQRHWRGYLTKSTFKLVKRDATLIQATYRSFRDRQMFLKKKLAAIKLASTIRLFLAGELVKRLQEQKVAKEKAEETATVILQAVFRGCIFRAQVRQLHRSATKIQSLFRGYSVKIGFQHAMSSIIKAQSIIRCWLSCRLLRQRKNGVIAIQSAVRKFLARVELRYLGTLKRKTLTEQKCALTIQRVVRGMLGRQLVVKDLSARMIQKTWRCYTVHVEYMLSILAAIDIQASFRRYHALTTYHRKYNAIVCLQSFFRLSLTKIHQRIEIEGAITLQSFARMIQGKASLLRKKDEFSKATSIQAAFRGYKSRSAHVYKGKSATSLQRYIRGYLVRLQLETEKFAATEIQRTWLGYVTREFYAWNILGAIKLQSFCRMIIARSFVRHVRAVRIAEHNLAIRSATTIQTSFRSFLFVKKVDAASIVIQRAVKCYLSRKTFDKVRKGILRAQCQVRGFLIRRKRTKKQIVQARRIGAATQKAIAAPKMKLWCRTKDALDILLRSKNLAEIMDAIVVLEMATRLSEACCVTFVDAGAPHILFSLIQTCNRSLPHIKLLHCVLRTMTNVVRFPYLVPSMATLLGVEVFLDLIQMFRDKDFVFCIVVSLLDRVVRSKEREMVSLITRENLKRLKGVRDLCVRKHSIGGNDIFSQRRMSLEGSLPISATPAQRQQIRGNNSKDRPDDIPDVRQGIRGLDRIIRLIERKGIGQPFAIRDLNQ